MPHPFKPQMPNPHIPLCFNFKLYACAETIFHVMNTDVPTGVGVPPLNAQLLRWTVTCTILVPPQEIQMELTMRDGVVDAMRLQAHKLLQGVGGCHINAASIHAKLDNLGRRWDHLQKLAQERYVSPWLHIWFHSTLVFGSIPHMFGSIPYLCLVPFHTFGSIPYLCLTSIFDLSWNSAEASSRQCCLCSLSSAPLPGV